MSKILTIVIPTYNMEKYLRHNLDSLIVPEDKQNLLEVLVINDGSKDESSAIGHEYQNKYPEEFRVIDKPNGNYGSCVNRGLAEAKGKYIKILDADDYFNNNVLLGYLEKLTETNADVVVTDFSFVTPENALIEKRSYPFEKNKIVAIDDVCASSAFKAIQMHALTYKTELIREINYHQTEGISYTDQEWIFLPMTNMKTVIYYPIDLYQYMIGREGQTMDPAVISKNLGHYYKIMNNRLDELSKRHLKLSTAMQEYLQYKSMRMTTFVYRAVLIRKIGSLKELTLLDDKIKTVDEGLYAALDAEKMKVLPYRYIHYYHRHHSCVPALISWIYIKLYTYVKVRQEEKKRKAMNVSK